MVEYWDLYDANRNKTGRVHKRGEPLESGDFGLKIIAWHLY